MATCSLELTSTLCRKLQFTKSRLSINTNLFIILFKLAQLFKFMLALISGKLHYQEVYTYIWERKVPHESPWKRLKCFVLKYNLNKTRIMVYHRVWLTMYGNSPNTSFWCTLCAQPYSMMYHIDHWVYYPMWDHCIVVSRVINTDYYWMTRVCWCICHIHSLCWFVTWRSILLKHVFLNQKAFLLIKVTKSFFQKRVQNGGALSSRIFFWS